MKYCKFLSFILGFNIFTFSQCNLPPINLGNDTVLCPGQSLNLLIEDSYLNPVWSDGTLGNSIIVTQAGTYSVSSAFQGNNLVINGDFEQGNIGFVTDYILGSVEGGGSVGLLTDVLTYEITSSPSLVHNNFNFCSHDGNMMVVNSATNLGPRIWCQTIAVQQNILYTLTAEVSNVINYPVVPELLFSVNNTQVGNIFSPSDFACDWVTFTATWNSGIATSAEICIYNINTDEVGNDFALDNIEFIPTCSYEDEIQVTYDQISYNLVDSLDFCSDTPELIAVETADSNLNFQWSTGEINDTISPQASGYYYLTITSVNNCSYNDSTYVTILTTPVASFSYSILNEDSPFEVFFQNTTTDGLSYHFNFDNGQQVSDNQINNYFQLYNDMGTYQIVLIAENGTCNDTVRQSIFLFGDVKIPDIFTPNGDQMNDEFFIKNLNNDLFEIQIFNRWGNLVFESADIFFKWDGKDQSGKECTPGTFFYKAFNNDFKGDTNYFQGNIQLVRD